MDIDKEQKDKILEWLCKRCGILDFFFDEIDKLMFHFIIDGNIIENVALIENEYKDVIRRKSFDDHVLDLLLDVSKEGYAVSNCVNIDNCYIKIIEPFCSLEQLQIEYDLCH